MNRPDPAEPSAASEKTKPETQAELKPRAALGLSAEMRRVLGPWPYRDPSDQVRADELMGILATEAVAGTTIQMDLVQRLTVLIHERRRWQRVIETTVALNLPRAARDVLCAGWSHFHPRDQRSASTNGTVDTAYGEFMRTGGDAVESLSDSEALAKATSKLATQGLPPEALEDHARVLALPEITKIEKILATKSVDHQMVLAQLLALLDRRRGRGVEKGPAGALETQP